NRYFRRRYDGRRSCKIKSHNRWYFGGCSAGNDDIECGTSDWRGYSSTCDVLLFETRRIRRKMPYLFGESFERIRKRSTPYAEACRFLPHDGNGWHGSTKYYLSRSGRST